MVIVSLVFAHVKYVREDRSSHCIGTRFELAAGLTMSRCIADATEKKDEGEIRKRNLSLLFQKKKGAGYSSGEDANGEKRVAMT